MREARQTIELWCVDTLKCISDGSQEQSIWQNADLNNDRFLQPTSKHFHQFFFSLSALFLYVYVDFLSAGYRGCGHKIWLLVCTILGLRYALS